MKKIVVCLLLVFLSSPCFASPWSKAFKTGDVKISGWSVRVDRLGSWMESYSVKFKWDISPSKIVITQSWGINLGQTQMDINARQRLADITVVARAREDLYALAGYIQHVEGQEVPFAVVWDRETRKARLFMGDEEWEEKVLQQ